jgi:beta-phosphoglucomutase-like phosphatase (HAD superfamily)
MIEAVGLGVRDVLVPVAAFRLAGIEAAAQQLEPHGVPADGFRRAARERLRLDGPRGLVSRSLRDLNLELPAGVQRQAVLRARAAVPLVQESSGLRTLLGVLAADHRIAFVDSGDPDVLDAVLVRLGLGSLPARRVWTRRLGRDVSPPRPFAFRWLAERWGLRPHHCLYLAGAHAGWQAARQAGWRVEPPLCPTTDEPSAWDPADLEAALERLTANVLAEGAS